MMGIPNEECDDLLSPGIVFCQTSLQGFLQMEPITDESEEMFSRNKHNTNIMHVGDTILDYVSESGIDENWCLFDNQST